MSTSANRTLVGLFVLGGLALTLGFLLALGGGWFAGDRPRALARFDQDVSGLDTGSAVRLRGVTVGKVASILVQVAGDSPASGVPVVLEIDPGLAARLGAGEVLGTQEGLEKAIQDGLTAKLRLQSFVTGVLYVDLDHGPARGQPPARVDDLPVIPTVLSDHVALTQAVGRTLENLSEVDFADLSGRIGKLADSLRALSDSPEVGQASKDLSAAMASLNRLATALDTQAGPLTGDLRATAEEARRTLAQLGRAADHLGDLAKPEGATRLQLDQSLQDLGEAAQAIKALADYLDRHPEALLRGKRTQEVPAESR